MGSTPHQKWTGRSPNYFHVISALNRITSFYRQGSPLIYSHQHLSSTHFCPLEFLRQGLTLQPALASNSRSVAEIPGVSYAAWQYWGLDQRPSKRSLIYSHFVVPCLQIHSSKHLSGTKLSKLDIFMFIVKSTGFWIKTSSWHTDNNDFVRKGLLIRSIRQLSQCNFRSKYTLTT